MRSESVDREVRGSDSNETSDIDGAPSGWAVDATGLGRMHLYVGCLGCGVDFPAIRHAHIASLTCIMHHIRRSVVRDARPVMWFTLAGRTVETVKIRA